MKNVISSIRAFMAGRNGIDQLAFACFIVILAADILLSIFRINSWLSLLPFALLIYAAFRVFSKNVVKRRNENYRFCAAMKKLRLWFAGFKARRAESAQYKFFRCPACKSRLRVPRGKGEIKITCSKCGQRFDGRT